MEPVASRAQVRRLAERASYDRNTLYQILDGAFLCHAGFVEEGQVFVIPTCYGRSGETLFLHGSAASRMLRSLGGGLDVCVTVTHVDGLVLARAAFHHSINYRSAVIFGRARLLADPVEKVEALRVISEQILKGRWSEVRPPNEKELKATAVIALSIADASAKLRTGPPKDDEEDYALPVWAGVLPLSVTAGEPQPDSRLLPGIGLPRSVLSRR